MIQKTTLIALKKAELNSYVKRTKQFYSLPPERQNPADYLKIQSLKTHIKRLNHEIKTISDT